MREQESIYAKFNNWCLTDRLRNSKSGKVIRVKKEQSTLEFVKRKEAAVSETKGILGNTATSRKRASAKQIRQLAELDFRR